MINLSKLRMHNVDDDFGHNQLFGLDDMITDFLDKESIVCEVGSFDGVSTELFAQKCKRVYSIDKQYRESLKEIVEKYNIIYFQKLSLEAYSLFSDNFFDCVYIDNDHRYEHVINEINFWLPKVKFGGIISGHDYLTSDYISKSKRNLLKNKDLKIKRGQGVKYAVDKFFNKVYLYKDSSWAFQKNKVFL
jgi:predicted O-methyltransferase YrrM